MTMNYYMLRHKNKCKSCELVGKSHNPNNHWCEDFRRFNSRLKVIKDITWGINEKELNTITQTHDLRLLMIRAFKMAQLVDSDEGAIIK